MGCLNSPCRPFGPCATATTNEVRSRLVVGLKWLLKETDSDKALRIRDEFRRQLHDLLAPDVFPVEVAHSLTRAERQGRITTAEGRSHFSDMIVTLPTLSMLSAVITIRIDIFGLDWEVTRCRRFLPRPK
jgi:hypothetical protein